MINEWAFLNNKVFIDFSKSYSQSEVEVLESKVFYKFLDQYLSASKSRNSKLYTFLSDLLEETDQTLMIKKLVKLLCLLTIKDSKRLSEDFDDFKNVYNNRIMFRKVIEEAYTYWRNLERYAIIPVSVSDDDFLSASFLEAKEKFDKLIITLYRNISNNTTIDKPTVYRQVPAGTNVAMTVYQAQWPIPSAYKSLKDVGFIKEIILESPFITYPSQLTRDGHFVELKDNPLNRTNINANNYYCYPAMVGDLLAYVYVERDFMTHGVSLANLFELPTVAEIKNKKPNLLLVFGAKEEENEMFSGYYDDTENDILVGYVSAHTNHDYFGYMKKMILTLNNIYNINKSKLPIHGAMVNIELNNGDKANVVIVGDSGAGKSESIEAFKALAKEHISDMTIIFDDMGTFALKDDKVLGYGTEIGAFVRLDDLDTGYAFKELDRSIFMNPDKINARLITPVATHKEITQGLSIDFLLYANNYTKLKDGQKAINYFEDLESGKDVFIQGKRMAKGTTTETGLTTSFFANPFGPLQMEAKTRVIIDEIFSKLEKEGCKIGEIYTQLGIDKMEKNGPKVAAIDLFEEIRKINK